MLRKDNTAERTGVPVVRPPWATEARVKGNCTGCNACIRACPEGILIGARAGAPVVDFNRGACTFCGNCAEACDEDVFLPLENAPWDHVAAIGAGCLLDQGVTCQSCQDGCDTEALRFEYGVGPAGAMAVIADNCTGCGACVALCPTRAISMARASAKVAA